MLRAGADAKVFANWGTREPFFLAGAEALMIRAVICPPARKYSRFQLISYGFPHCFSLEQGATDEYPKEPQPDTERRPPMSLSPGPGI